MKRRKIAVFLSGPVRYVTLVRDSVSRAFGAVDHDFFYHLWRADLGNKVRQGYQSDVKELYGDERTKLLLLHRPYGVDFFKPLLGTHMNTHSSVNAVVGMLLGLAQLCRLFEVLPDREAYTHIFRIRTDCALTTERFVELLDWESDAVTISSEPNLHEGWLNDQLLFAPAELFLKIYHFENIREVYQTIEEGRRNPEKIMYHLVDRALPVGVKLLSRIERFRDYQIVYSPPRPTDQPWVRALVDQGRIPELFSDYSRFRQVAEDEGTRSAQGANLRLRDPYRSRSLNALRRIYRRMGGS